MKFVWDDECANIGHYYLFLAEDDNKIIDAVLIKDYTCLSCQEIDKKNNISRPFAFNVSHRVGYPMNKGFDYDEYYDKHVDDNGKRIGGYQGKITYTLEDVRKWCENYIAQIYLNQYASALKMQENSKTLEEKRLRAEWFTSQGFVLEDKES